MAGSIRISVVLLWRGPRDALSDCLRTLVDQVAAVDGEVVVVTAGGRADGSTSVEASSHVRLVEIDPPLTEARAWEAGVCAARGARVAFGDAACRFRPGWARAALSAEIDRGSVAAGPVHGPRGPLAALAAYLCDYGAFANPHGPGGAGAPSNNVVFDRLALVRLARGQGLDKTQVLREGRFRVRWVPALGVTILDLPSFWVAARMRYHRGRRYAARRAERWSRMLRWAAGCASTGLPALLLSRLIADRHLRRRFGRSLLFGFPCVAVLLVTWSLGEMAGYWTGAGSSARYV